MWRKKENKYLLPNNSHFFKGKEYLFVHTMRYKIEKKKSIQISYQMKKKTIKLLSNLHLLFHQIDNCVRFLSIYQYNKVERFFFFWTERKLFNSFLQGQNKKYTWRRRRYKKNSFIKRMCMPICKEKKEKEKETLYIKTLLFKYIQSSLKKRRNWWWRVLCFLKGFCPPLLKKWDTFVSFIQIQKVSYKI